jgi:hypothetical protein
MKLRIAKKILAAMDEYGDWNRNYTDNQIRAATRRMAKTKEQKAADALWEEVVTAARRAVHGNA